MFKMKGVVPPMITPFDARGEVDVAALGTLVRYLRDRVDGLFITGSYGGGALMTEAERKLVVETTIRETAGKIPVVVHVGTADNVSTARLADHAVANGAAAVSAVGAFYYKHDEDEICAFYDAIVKACGGRVPVYVYNNPQFQGYPMELKTIRKLKESVGVNGIKDATFDIIMHAHYMRLFKDDAFDVALGTEAMWLPACALGCDAFIPGLGNAFPEICGEMYRQGAAGDYAACRDTQFRVNAMREIMYVARSTQLAIYAMLEIRDIVACLPRGPFVPAGNDEKKEIRRRLSELGVL
jgi:dihydrodipicolinate synthase/N-acetylneuraminate lyase